MADWICVVCSKSVLDTGKKLSDDNTIGQEEIQQRLAQFVDHWKELKDLSGARWAPWVTQIHPTHTHTLLHICFCLCLWSQRKKA